MPSIQFDGTEILNSTYNPRFVKHESNPERFINSLELAREDGAVFISEKFGKKVISLQGVLVGSTQSDLESKINTFKELFSRPEKNLDVDWAGGTLRYVATCTLHEFDRDHFHLNFVPWTAEFTVSSGEGKDTSTTTARNQQALTTTTPATDSFTLSGGKPPKPVITIQGSNFTGATAGIEYLNTDTGEKIQVTRNITWGNTDSVIIDCLNRKVTGNLSTTAFLEYNFYGVFPNFKIGTNNVQVSVGGLVNQQTSENGVFSDIGTATNLSSTTRRIAQSFTVPYTDNTFKGITICATKTGSPGTITWRIESDANGSPSGTLVNANATGTIAAASVSGSYQYLTSYSTNMWGLNANTKYWIVLSAASVDGSNFYAVAHVPSTYAVYPRGYLKDSTDSGGTYTTTLTTTTSIIFKVRFGGQPQISGVKHSVVYTKTYI